MNRKNFLKSIIAQSKSYPIIFTTGYTCREAYNIQDSDNHFYMVGSMGMAPSLGMGLALSTAQPVIVVDGDGSLLMNPSNLFMAAALDVNNLIHILLDNESYDSTGGQSTISNDFDFKEISQSIGYKSCIKVGSITEFEQVLKESLIDLDGPTLIWAKISTEKSHPGVRIEKPLEKIRENFSNYLLKDK